MLERASARETAARVAAGAVAKAVCRSIGIEVRSHVLQIGSVRATPPAWLTAADFDRAEASEVRCLDPSAEQAMIAEIEAAKNDRDTLGGVTEVRAFGVPPGLGSHVSAGQRLDGRLAAAMLSIQSAKGVEIGDAIASSGRRGSSVHDEIHHDDGRGFYRETDRAGGLEGGITNGADLIVRVIWKPLPTLMRPLRQRRAGQPRAAGGARRAQRCHGAAGGRGRGRGGGGIRARPGRAGEVRRRRDRGFRGRSRRLHGPRRAGMIPGPYRNIALIGFMGSGKSTLAGRWRSGWAGMWPTATPRSSARPASRSRASSLEDGEAAFRELEERAVARLPERMDVVIALGGGAITSPVTRERLRDGSFTVLLDVSVQTAWRRIEAEADDRPLAVEARGFADLYEQRRPLYHAAADALVDAEQLEGGEPLLVPLSRPAALAELPRLVGARRAALIADRAVLRLVGAPVEPLVTVRLPVGEAAKTVAVARQAWTRLADLGLERGDVVVGLGGGAATDAAGFVAATYQRGVPWIAAPTSLVGMVDAAIGGKTGIDLPGAKNYVGAFHPAEWVVTDPGLLETLPVREWACGFAEVIKTGLLAGGRLWEMVQAWEPGRGSTEQRLELIRRCAAYKAHVVADRSRASRACAPCSTWATRSATRSRPRPGSPASPTARRWPSGCCRRCGCRERLPGSTPRVEGDVRELLRMHELPTGFAGVDAAAVREALAPRQEVGRGPRPVRAAGGGRQAGLGRRRRRRADRPRDRAGAGGLSPPGR